MTFYAFGFIVFSLFTLGVGVLSLIFISFDAPATDTPQAPTTPTPHGFPVVRRITTGVIETVDADGVVQRWSRDSQPDGS